MQLYVLVGKKWISTLLVSTNLRQIAGENNIGCLAS